MSRFPAVRFLLSAANAGQFPPDRGAEVAFAGRSNAGKSSAINALVHREGLARTSKTPGRTRLLNFFQLAPGQRIVDLPGYGYASVPGAERRKWIPMLDALRYRESLRGLMLIVDSRRGVAAADREVIEWLRAAGRDIPVHVLLSKADKLNRSESTKALAAAQAALAGTATVQLFSAVKNIGVEDARGVLETWFGERGQEKTPATSGEATGAD